MIPLWHSDDIARATGGTCSVPFAGTGVSIDTRTLQPGDLFVALVGEHGDGHAFVADALGRGAAGALVHQAPPGAADTPLVVVGNTLDALNALGAFARARFTGRVLAVTGSVGKTTCKEMLRAALAATGPVHAAEASYNNHWGVPLTLARMPPGHAFAVVEIGMNHPGEIARLAEIAAPTVAVVNNAQREHLEFMASVQAVARENGGAIAALAGGGVAVFPADDAHAAIWREIAGQRRLVTFALAGAAAADVTGSAIWHGDHSLVRMQTPASAASFTLRVAGAHNVRNALAAGAAALAAGCPLDAIVRGLEGFRAVRGRSQTKRLVRGGVESTLIDDTYNANPDSVRAAIDVLAALPAPRWLVLGDMAEVGDQGPEFHREVGAYARQRGIESLWAAGAASGSTVADFPGARAFATVEELIAALDRAPKAASVLVKGSRFMRMERVVRALTGEAGDLHA